MTATASEQSRDRATRAIERENARREKRKARARVRASLAFLPELDKSGGTASLRVKRLWDSVAEAESKVARAKAELTATKLRIRAELVTMWDADEINGAIERTVQAITVKAKEIKA